MGVIKIDNQIVTCRDAKKDQSGAHTANNADCKETTRRRTKCTETWLRVRIRLFELEGAACKLLPWRRSLFKFPETVGAPEGYE